MVNLATFLNFVKYGLKKNQKKFLPFKQIAHVEELSPLLKKNFLKNYSRNQNQIPLATKLLACSTFYVRIWNHLLYTKPLSAKVLSQIKCINMCTHVYTHICSHGCTHITQVSHKYTCIYRMGLFHIYNFLFPLSAISPNLLFFKVAKLSFSSHKMLKIYSFILPASCFPRQRDVYQNLDWQQKHNVQIICTISPIQKVNASLNTEGWT